MNRVGMMVDCSHTAYRTTMEAMEASDAPVIFSHSCAKALRNHGRNIVDEQIKACAKTGGVVGINGVSMFLGENDISSETFVNHIAHMPPTWSAPSMSASRSTTHSTRRTSTTWSTRTKPIGRRARITAAGRPPTCRPSS